MAEFWTGNHLGLCGKTSQKSKRSDHTERFQRELRVPRKAVYEAGRHGSSVWLKASVGEGWWVGKRA